MFSKGKNKDVGKSKVKLGGGASGEVEVSSSILRLGGGRF